MAPSPAEKRSLIDLWEEFPEFEPRVKEALRSYSKNSQLALRADWRTWRSFTFSQNCPVLPARVADVVAFVLAHSPSQTADERRVLAAAPVSDNDRAKAASTVQRYLHSLSAVHRLARLPDPTKDADVAAVRRRVTRGRGAKRQKTGVNRPLLEDLLSVLGDSLWDRRGKAMLLTAYCTLARSAELVALTVEDLRVSEHGDGYAIIRSSKTDPEGQGSHRYLAGAAIEALKAWIDAVGIKEGYIFRRIHKHGGVTAMPVDPHEVARVLRAVIRRLPMEKRPMGEFAGHSTRIGAAQDLVAAGQDLLAVMQAGGWKDPKMPARYTEHLAAMRGGMAQLWARAEPRLSVSADAPSSIEYLAAGAFSRPRS